MQVDVTIRSPIDRRKRYEKCPVSRNALIRRQWILPLHPESGRNLERPVLGQRQKKSVIPIGLLAVKGYEYKLEAFQERYAKPWQPVRKSLITSLPAI